MEGMGREGRKAGTHGSRQRQAVACYVVAHVASVLLAMSNCPHVLSVAHRPIPPLHHHHCLSVCLFLS